MIIMLFPIAGNAQNYSIQFDESEFDLCCNELMINEQEEAMLLSFENNSRYFYLTKINPSSGQNKCFQFEYNNIRRPWLPEWQEVGTLYSGDYAFFQHMPENELTTSLVMFNTEDETFWARKLQTFGIHHRLTFDEENKLLYTFETQGHSQGADAFTMKGFCFDIEGNDLWGAGYRITSNFNVSQINLADVALQGDNLIAMMALGRPEDFATGLIRFDLLGNVEESIIIENHAEVFNMSISDDGFIYLLGETRREQQGLGSTLNAVLIKLDQNLNVIWSNIITAESFDIRASKIKCVGEDIYLAYASFGNLSVILAKITSEGEIEVQKGLPHYQPKLFISDQGSFYLSYYEESDLNGGILNRSGIIKTTILDESDACPFYTSCLELIPFETETNVLNVIKNITSPVELDTIFVQEKNITHEDYCLELEIPDPKFEFPNGLCAPSCERPTSFDRNTFLNEEWLLVNENQDTVYIGEEAEEWCFEENGNYELSHSIWYLGCEHRHEVSIEVFDEFSFEIQQTDPVCFLTDPTLLEIVSTNEIQSANWSNGAEGAQLEVFEPGVYEVTASDGICTSILSIDVFRPTILEEELLDFEDTKLLCRIELPDTLRPFTEQNNLFYINDDSELLDSIIILNDFGRYTIKTEYRNCIIEKEFNLLEDNCEVAIYIPNAFSPNRDGINDEFLPYGNNFEVNWMRIFDRWGNMVFESSELQQGWNGRFRNKELDPGVYFYTMEYVNEKSLEIENVKGDLLLNR